MNTLKAQDIADMIDHSLLNPAFTTEEIKKGLRLQRNTTAFPFACVPAT